MLNRRLNHIVFFISIVSLIYGCETASTIDDPTKNYFIKYYGGDGNQEGVDVVVAPDGFIYLLGNSTASISTVGKQLYLVKTDEDGQVVWEKTFGGKFDEEAKDLELTADNRLVVLANSNKGAAENDILLMTFTLDGLKIDSALHGLKTITGSEADDDASSVSITTDGFIVSGATTSITSKGSVFPGDLSDVLHLRVNNDLTIYTNWSKTSGTIGFDGAAKVHQVNPTTYYVFGYSNINVNVTSGTSDYNFWVYQLGATGDPSTNQMYPGDIITDEKLTAVMVSPVQSGEGFLLAGTSLNPSTESVDIYVNKLRKLLTFNESLDYLIDKPLTANLGKPGLEKSKVNVFASSSSGFLLLANERTATSNNFYLTKIDNDGKPWPDPLLFGGQRDDYIGAVAELPDGKIILLGTMSIGDEGQKKMALIKVNKEGKFAN